MITRLLPWSRRWPANVWIGTTVEDQEAADPRLPHLVALPAVVRLISAEPLTSALDLGYYIDRLDWVIAGGEVAYTRSPAVRLGFAASEINVLMPTSLSILSSGANMLQSLVGWGRGDLSKRQTGQLCRGLARAPRIDASTDVSGISCHARARSKVCRRGGYAIPHSRAFSRMCHIGGLQPVRFQEPTAESRPSFIAPRNLRHSIRQTYLSAESRL